jgi:hypothetical protein
MSGPFFNIDPISGSDLSGTNFGIAQNIIFPQPLVAGDQWIFQMWGGNYASSGYGAFITIAAATTKLSAAAALNSGWYMWSIPGSSTSKLAAQPYRYNVNVVDPSGNRLTIERGSLVVEADISVSGTNVTSQTNLQLMLAACDATLISLLSNKATMVQFAGQSYQMHDIQKLFEVRSDLNVRVKDEQQELRGNKKSQRIITVFRTM